MAQTSPDRSYACQDLLLPLAAAKLPRVHVAAGHRPHRRTAQRRLIPSSRPSQRPGETMAIRLSPNHLRVRPPAPRLLRRVAPVLPVAAAAVLIPVLALT